MRLLHMQKGFGWLGGLQRHLLELLPSLVDRGHEVLVVQLGEIHPSFLHALRNKGVDVEIVPAGTRLDPLLPVRLRRRFRTYDPAVVHAHGLHAAIYGSWAARWARVPSVLGVHGTHKTDQEPFQTAQRVAGRLAQRTIAISEHVRRFIIDNRMAPPDRVDVVHYGLDLAAWVRSTDDRRAARATFGLASDDVAVGIAARLIPGKGHNVLLDAVALALGRAPSLVALIAGEGPINDELRAQASERGLENRARFLGFLEDVPAFMSACDVVAFPTLPELDEGFGLSALEAMAAARPVVASWLGPIPEVVDDGVTGLLVPPGDAPALADALVRIAEDGPARHRLGEAGRDRASSLFTIDVMVDRTLHVYESVVNAPRV